MFREEIICAGFGGQGIMLMGKLLSYAGMKRRYNVTWMPSYGAEVRGGTAHCMIVISDDKIPSPILERPDIAIIMNAPSMTKFERSVKKGGVLIMNTSLIPDKLRRRDLNVIKLPFTDIAARLGNSRVANMVAIGAYLARTKIFRLNEIARSLQDVIPKYRRNLLKINLAALKEGIKLARRKS